MSRLSLSGWRTTLVIAPLLTALDSTLLFFVQGGSEGGHGKFDGLIVTLGLPSIDLVQKWVLYFALTYTVILPTVMNTVSVWITLHIRRTQMLLDRLDLGARTIGPFSALRHRLIVVN